MSCNLRIIHERGVRPSASQVTPTLIRTDNSFSEYSLKQNFFDPTKSSPPNDFMIKLKQRMSLYNTTLYSNTNDDSCERE